jgi:hypothetical protein
MSIFRKRPPREAEQQETASPSGEGPFPGYDRMKADDVVTRMSDLTQVELAAVEAYERSHKQRPEVLNKLRYMRSPEPVKGYDELSPDEIAKVLESADGQQVKAIRDYERKFQGRRQVLDEAARVLPEARESAANAKAREDKAERVRVGMRKAPGKDRD